MACLLTSVVLAIFLPAGVVTRGTVIFFGILIYIEIY